MLKIVQHNVTLFNTMLLQDISRVLTDQQAEFSDLLSSNEVSRPNEIELKELLPASSIKVILGVRRAGKSTLIARVLRPESTVYVNFDDDRWTDLETEDLQRLYLEILRLMPNVQFWFFDEIQNVPKWELFISRLYREKRNIIITGSNGKLLGKDLATHLTGRHLSIEIFPFNFSEYLELKKFEIPAVWTSQQVVSVRSHFSKFFNVGGFPEVLQGAPAGRYLRELFDRIISRDLVQRYKLRQSRGIKELALFLINNVGQRITYQKLAKSLGFKSVTTVRNYVSYLCDGYLLFELEAFSLKVKEQMTLPRKVYAIDTGMIEALNRKATPDMGSRLENIVYLQLRKNGHSQLSYLKGDRFEVDFVIHKGRKVDQLIQVCLSLQDTFTLEREVRGLILGASYVKCSNLLLLTWDEERNLNQNNVQIKVLPVWKWVLGLS